MLVKDVMTSDPITVSVETTVKDAAARLTAHKITALPVIDAAGELCGVLSEADILHDGFARDPRSHLNRTEADHRTHARLVSEVMSADVMSVQATTDLAAAAEIMRSTSFKSLPVVDETGRLVGVLSRSDLVGVRARADGLIAQEVTSLLNSLDQSDWTVEVADGIVSIDGPHSAQDRSMAETVAASVPGVVSVQVN